MLFAIDLFFPKARAGSAPEIEALGECKVLSPRVFVTITLQSGAAQLVALDDLVMVDRASCSYTTALGRTKYPKSIDFPDRIFVEAAGGHTRVLSGDQIARMTRSKRDAPGKGVSWAQ